MPHQASKHCIAVVKQMLDTEVAIVRTYLEAIERFGDDPDVAVLLRIRGEHVMSARRLLHTMSDLGADESDRMQELAPATRSTETFSSGADDLWALDDLHHWEARGRHLYEEALQDPEVEPELKTIIGGELLPRQERHLRLLEALVAEY